MTPIMKFGAAILISAGMSCAGTAWAQTASENAVQAAMDACEQARESDAKMHCELHVLAAQQSMQAESEGSEGVIHFDFNDNNDSDAHKSAKQALYGSLNNCEMSGNPASQISQCRMEAFNKYQGSLGQ